MIRELHKELFTISTDRSRLDLESIHQFLSQSYWSEGIPRDIVKKSVENSLCFGVYLEEEQVGFARVVTDYCTFAWLADVFIIEKFQGKGLGKWLIEFICSQPDLKNCKNILLATRDAHRLYAKFGFKPIEDIGSFMIIRKKNLYVL